jgi:outer membrane protein assembly factor BamB
MSDSMPTPQDAAPVKPRIWPAVVIIAMQWIVITGMAYAFEGTMLHFFSMFMGPSVGAFLILLWWLFFSRVSWGDRLFIPILCAGLVALVMFVGHETIGAFGIMMFGLPAAMTAWIGFLVISMPLDWGAIRRLGSVIVITSAFCYLLFVRMDGVSGGMSATMNWRWTPTTEQHFLAEREGLKLANGGTIPTEALTLQPGDWPCFRGPNRDNRITGVKIPTDWSAHPPKQLWRHKVGPGWGSFAVVGKYLFTQEQWDQNEAVICYDGDTGKMVWSREEPARFTEPVAGPGPRATPTFHEGKLFTMGAAGKLCCLDAANGKLVWSQNILDKTDAKVPQWGFAASPLIMDGIVMVFAGGTGKSVVAYDASSGDFAWASGDGKLSYCSLHRAKVHGVGQALLMSGDGLTAFQAKDGKILWNHAWPVEGAARCIQPTAVGDADFLIGTGFGHWYLHNLVSRLGCTSE